jgi:PAS domain S-box-containing protein
MKTGRDPVRENEELRRRLSEAEELLAAIKSGSVDAFITDDRKVFTLKGADHAYRVLVETMNEGAATLAPDGVVMYCNKRMAGMLRAPIADVTGKSIIDYVHPRDQVKFQRLLKGGVRGKSGTRENITLRRTDRRELDVNVSCNPLRLESPLACMVFTDVSRLRAAQLELEKANSGLESKIRARTAQLKAANRGLEEANAELASANDDLAGSNEMLRMEMEERRKLDAELRRSNENLERFAYVASHDLREPLRTISSYSELLARRYKGKLDRDADDFIGFILDGSERMQSLISDILTYSRVGSGGRVREEVDCGAVLEGVTKSLAQEIRESRAVITSGTLPTIVGNENSFVQLFQNLMDNAIKFRGGDPPRIHVGAERSDAGWEFSVSDNGIGIDPAQYDRIFMIFQRLHERGKYPGTGVGLAICRKIVENLGGKIWVESEPGKGATFRFTVPEMRADAGE